MGLRNSEIIICKNIKLDKDYKNVLSYTESEMLTLCRTNAVAIATDYSFIRKEKGYIKTSFSYNDALKCNYMAFQNKDYSNKWFFAFIDDVEYVSDGTCTIRYTVDEFSTWYDYWYTEPCLVLREHVASDNIGEHTYPENLEHGPYIVNSYQELGGFEVENCKVVIGVTWLPSNTPNLPSTQYYGGTFSGVYYMAFDYINAKKFVLALDGLGRGDAIVAAFMAPSSLCVGQDYEADITSKQNDGMGSTTTVTYHIIWRLIPNNLGGIMILNDQTIPMNNNLNTYTPKNNKLYTFPYNYLLITNNAGGNAEFHYEDFINNLPIFNIIGTLSPGCSIKLYPENYKKIADGEGTYPGFNDGLVGAKFPICSWQNDSFTNWMTQQSVNTLFAKVGAVAKIASIFGNIATGGLGATDKDYAGLFNQQASYLSEKYEHALTSPQSSGSINGGDVTFARNEQNFGIYKMSIKSEYARKLDEYFNKFGYQVNEIKSPNVTGRPYWNFVQIGSYENIGYPTNTIMSVPAGSMEKINSIYRSGVTIWHDHTNLGNYNLDNSIPNT